MNWEAFLQPQALPEYVAATTMLALAAWLVYLGPRSAANVAFASFLVFRAFSMFTFTFQHLLEASGSAGAAEILAWERVRPPFVIGTVVALGFFLLCYLRVRGGAARRAALLGLGSVGILSIAAYVARPSLWASYDVQPDAAGVEHVAFASVGPLFAFQLLRSLGIGLAALVFCSDYRRSPGGPAADSLLVVAIAFAVHGVFDGSDSAQLLLTVSPAEVYRWTYVQIVAEAVNLLPIAVGIVLLLRRAAASGDPRVRRSVRRWAAVPLFPALTNALVFVLVVAGLEPRNGPASLFFLGFWRLSLPLMVTYALVKHGLFGIDVKVKRTIQRAVVALVFVLVFFAVSEGAEALVAGRAGPYLGILATAALTFALAPLQRFAERVADAAMPNVQSVSELSRHERAALYRALARSAWETGNVSEDERRMLDVARLRLGIAPGDADAIEAEGRKRATTTDSTVGAVHGREGA